MGAIQDFNYWAQCINEGDLKGAEGIVKAMGEHSKTPGAKQFHSIIAVQHHRTLEIIQLLQDGNIEEARGLLGEVSEKVRDSLRALSDIYELQAMRKESNLVPTPEDKPMILFFTDLQKNLPKNGEAGSAR